MSSSDEYLEIEDKRSKIAKLMVEIENIPDKLCESYCRDKWFDYRRNNCEEKICIGIEMFLWAITHYIKERQNKGMSNSSEDDLIILINSIIDKLFLNTDDRNDILRNLYLKQLMLSSPQVALEKIDKIDNTFEKINKLPNADIAWLKYSVPNNLDKLEIIVDELTRLKTILDKITEKQYVVITKILQQSVNSVNKRNKLKESEIDRNFIKELEKNEEREYIENANNHKNYCEFNKFNCWSFGKLRPNKCKKDCGIHLKNFREKHEFGDNLLNIRVGGIRRTTKKTGRKKSRKIK